MTFDAREIKMLAPGQHLTSSEFPGLRVEAFADRRTWTYRYRSPIDQALRQMKIGLWPAMSIHSAVAQWEVLREQRAAGRDPAQEAKDAKRKARADLAERRSKALVKQYTVADVCSDYHAGHIVPNRKPKGATEVRRMFDKLLGEFGALPAAEVTRAQAFDYIKGLAELHPVQAGKLRTELGSAWDYAYDAGRLQETTPNWWRLILRGKLKSKGKKIAGVNIGSAKRCLDASEIGTLIRWLPNFSQLINDGLTMYLWTACRGSEIFSMTGDEVAEEEGRILWWTVPKLKTKNARHQNATDLRVPLFGRARAVALRRKLIYGEGPLFPARLGGSSIVRPIEQKSFTSAVYAYQPYATVSARQSSLKLPVTHWSPHDLRRSSRTLLAKMGCPNEVGEAILGHLPPGIVGVYNLHAYDAERVEWLKRLSDHLEQLAASD